MTLAHSPSIVTNGLVYYHDMSNTQKSWKGKPSTNYINATPTWAGDGVNQSSFTKGSVEITNPALMYYGLKTFLWSPGASVNCYLQSDDIVGGTATTSATWTFSCYVKAEDSRPITALNVYMYFPTSDGASAGTITDAGNGWYRISRTRTGTASYIALAGFTGFVANIRYYLSGAMLTMDDMMVAPLAGNTTRSTSNNIVDLTGKNTITANSLTYNSNNTFSFNGSSSYFSVLSSPSLNITSAITLAAWIYPTSSAGYPGIIAKGYATTGGYSLQIRLDNSLWFELDSATTRYTYNPTSTVLTLNSWSYVVATYDGTIMNIYINNQVVGAGSAQTVTMGVISTDVFIGQLPGYGYLNGQLDQAKIYNRALSAKEVTQNFNAHRGRYGL
jgi:hypothetical protein